MKTSVMAAVLAFSIGGTASGNAMEISRNQCESIRRDLVDRLDVLISQGRSVAEAIRSIGVTEVTY